ncbi:prepilin peptidase [Micromonospora craterilacus]|uniref:prepilin peptidase n=1 Tax=Micromonospora craterilacus TaxID=1655439 RepID=UPI001F25E3F6|nr:prepilin peptidase [Micromonospora craterilacus]
MDGFWSVALLGALAGVALPPAWARTVAGMRASGSRRAIRGPWRALAVCGSAVGVAAGSVAIAWRVHDRQGGVLLVAAWLAVLYAGLLLAAVDAATRRLPSPIVRAAAITVGACLVGHAAVTGQWRTLATALLACGVLGGGYLLLALAGGSAVGMGDVRLAAVLGASLGALGWSAVMWGAALPYVLAVPEALARLASPRRSDLAFGPYLLAGALLAVALGP